jgi:hypothetical protein
LAFFATSLPELGGVVGYEFIISTGLQENRNFIVLNLWIDYLCYFLN